ncbi:tetratricopeptide repeat protein [Bartonella sp. TP]|uniref:DUF2659 family protein n=1 Tax=Bartonella sp. TP TaxID=3057550 RepID=UPI0025B1E041|nr:tetratricopeptide repeat protein [Bartonella sp. TP]MDN5249436.1 tetratricopeptide repeat protein [Alphaproteobacteria bacterium]WJW80223.1 tetratricopeptide repeat protein [Bartonella sp. TP]
MEHNNFIDEVNEELKLDRMSDFGRKFALPILISLVSLLFLVGAWRIYVYVKEQRIEKLGDSFSEALEIADRGQSALALGKLTEIEASRIGNYPDLARLSKANLLKKNGSVVQAKQQLLFVMQDQAAPILLKNIARLKLSYLFADEGDVDAVTKNVEPFLNDQSSFQLLAWEALGLAYVKQNKSKQAEIYFHKILDHDKTSSGVAQRARLMLDVLAT